MDYIKLLKMTLSRLYMNMDAVKTSFKHVNISPLDKCLFSSGLLFVYRMPIFVISQTNLECH